jgi:hypothetical protein
MALPVALSPFQNRALRLLTDAGVTFTVVGGIAMQAHGFERQTRDLDILVSREPVPSASLWRLLPLLVEGPAIPLALEQLQLPRKLINLPSQKQKEVDILTSIGALDTEAAVAASRVGLLGSVSARFLDLKELIYTKLVSAEANQAPAARERDLADLATMLARWHGAA